MKDKKPKKTIFMAGTAVAKKRFLTKNNCDFAISRTNRTTKITLNGVKYVYGCGSGFSFKRLTLHSRLKKEIKDNIISKNLSHLTSAESVNNIKYYHFNENVKFYGIGEVIEDCTSFDINKAYYNCAFNKGYISKSFYDECIQLDKIVRLGLIGSIATKKTTFHYKGGNLVNSDVKEDLELRKVWFSIVKEVDDCLNELSIEFGDDFIFYWVDGIYVKGNKEKHKDLIERISKKYNFEFKNEPVDCIVFAQDDNRNKMLKVYKEELRGRLNKKNEPADFKPFTLNSQLQEYKYKKR